MHFNLELEWVSLGRSMVKRTLRGTAPTWEKSSTSLHSGFNGLGLKKKGEMKKIPHIESNLKWAKSRDIDIKGTPLLWHNAIPKWIKASADAEEIEPLISNRIRYLINEYPEVRTWDLYNEAVGAEKKFANNNPIANWLKSKGGPATAQAWVSRIAHQAAPDRIYVNNHYSHKDPAFQK